uniref:Probable cation-transporting ATPase (inferred by orthology to a C. elegans protein) n=1 Tax=Strongyloides venezuelensis TaxID=75913 RepID=A0A0K0FQ55_STRVS
MCGDGTYDVGALKLSHVGVAHLSHPFDATKANNREVPVARQKPMLKILALNALASFYSQPVLYSSYIHFSGYQQTIQGMLLPACFLFKTRSKPLKILSREKPIANIFNVYTILTISLQFCIHFFCLLYIVDFALTY